MRKTAKIWIAAAMSGVLLANGAGVTGQAPWGLVAEAHGGRTDSQGGHRDNKNASGLGSYHYHCGGHPAHLHTNGVCPYDGGSGSSGGSGNAAAPTQAVPTQAAPRQAASTQAASTQAAPKQAATEPAREQSAAAGNRGGWHHDGDHWRYTCDDGTAPAGCWKQIDSTWYCFDSEGCMRTGWYEEDGCQYYLGSDGRMITGTCTIDGKTYQFDKEGKMVSPDSN